MLIKFEKYQGAGNDFIIIDNRFYNLNLKPEQIQFLCDRRFGIGADGLMTINLHPVFDFEMKYFNSDGNESTMCGNGGRCIAMYAYSKKIAREIQTFIAVDGLHYAQISDNNNVFLSMIDVENFIFYDDGYFLNTGSPHFVQFCNNLSDIDVFAEGQKLANDKRFAPERTNVNFVEPIDFNNIKIATYERGVENETLACGTGSVAAAIAYFLSGKTHTNEINVRAKGGKLKVKFRHENGKFTNVLLIGPAQKVFSGEIELNINI